MSSKDSAESIADLKKDMAFVVDHVNKNSKYTKQALQSAGEIFEHFDRQHRKHDKGVIALAIAVAVQAVYLIIML